MAIASPQRGEVGGGNCVGSDLATASDQAAAPPPPASPRWGEVLRLTPAVTLLDPIAHTIEHYQWLVWLPQ